MNFMDMMVADNRQPGRLIDDLVIELCSHSRCCVEFDMNSIVAVAYPSTQIHCFCQLVDEGPEPYSLYLAADMNVIGCHLTIKMLARECF